VEKVAKFFKLQDHKAVFHQYSAADKMPLKGFVTALNELGISSNSADPSHLFKEADIDEDGFLDVEEFGRVISRPSKLEQWLSTLPLARLLSFCLEAADQSLAASPDPLRVVSCLDPPVLSAVMDGFCDGAKRLLGERARNLSTCYAALDRKTREAGSGSNAKFQNATTMSAGTAESFHKGVTDRIGASAGSVLHGFSASQRSFHDLQPLLFSRHHTL